MVMVKHPARASYDMFVLVFINNCRVVRKIVRVCPRVLVIGDDCGDLPLHMACASDQVAMVKELLQCSQGEETGKRSSGRRKLLKKYTLESLDTRSVCYYSSACV